MRSLFIPILILLNMPVFSQHGGFYYLKVTSDHANVRCFLNGFPVYNIKSVGEIINQTPVNLALVGKHNQLTILASPVEGKGKVQGTIAFYQSGDVVSSDDERPGLVSFELEVSKKNEKTVSFDNDIFDFSTTLQKSPVITNEQDLKSYAITFLHMIKDKDMKGLLSAMQPKIKDYAAGFSAPEEAVKQSLESTFREGLFGLSFPNLKTDDIVPVSYCDGRVWELRTRDGQALIHAKDGDGEISLPVFVAKIDGELKVVR